MRYNYVVIPEGQRMNGTNDETDAIKSATAKLRQYQGNTPIYVYKLHKIVQPKAVPVEIKDVSL
jgi:hypothetical protein